MAIVLSEMKAAFFQFFDTMLCSFVPCVQIGISFLARDAQANRYTLILFVGQFHGN
jgi:hypothetical protein